MRSLLVLAALGLAAATARPDAKDDAAKADLKKLAGTWEVTQVEIAGMKATGEKFGVDRVVVTGTKMTILFGKKELFTMKLALDPTKTPKAADLIREKNGVEEQLPALYEVSDTEFKLAMPLVPKERKPGEDLPRPASFDTAGKPVMVLTTRRVKE